MKIQNLAVIFIIIILPISLVFASYTKNRVETINLQSNYDSKLNDATHDAIKAYQLNNFTNDDTISLTNSKIRDIKASVNTFFNSLSTNFNTLGYTKTTLQNYVPALVYTMYDGYYIYTPLQNTWNTGNDTINSDVKNEMSEQINSAQDYKDGEKIYDLKPYVYYSCRYRRNDDNDVVITYSLDNYIQIQGKIGGQLVSKYGYLLSTTNSPSSSKGLYVNNDNIKYNGISIDSENNVKENICTNDGVEEYAYIKHNGRKYYLDNNNNQLFYVLKGEKVIQNNSEELSAEMVSNNNSAKKYYTEAYEISSYIQNTSFLRDLTTDDIVDVNTGKRYGDDSSIERTYYSINGNQKIFDFDNSNGIESETSNFNTHRMDVIKNSIERNLSIAIANFNNYSGVQTDFQMPKLKETDWDKIMSNISLISFFQGANIGGKVYNGYSIVTNTKNEDVVMEDSIYIKKGSGNNSVIYGITDNDLGTDFSNAIGVFNINTEPRVGSDESTYYMPVDGTFSYGSIITKNNIADNFNGNLSEYIINSSNDLKKIYYTALGRERYGIYRLKLKI